MRKLMVWWFKQKGWKIANGIPPDIKQCVIIAAPHTSNWDFVYSIATFDLLRLPVRFLAKKELFKWPLKSLMLSVGGMPVQRNKSTKLVDTMIDLFKPNEGLLLMIPAEGTRGKVEKWKSGFYHVALGAKVPILLGYLDYANKTSGFGPAFYPTGNTTEDAAFIKQFYADKTGRNPELFDLEAVRFD